MFLISHVKSNSSDIRSFLPPLTLFVSVIEDCCVCVFVWEIQSFVRKIIRTPKQTEPQKI